MIELNWIQITYGAVPALVIGFFIGMILFRRKKRKPSNINSFSTIKDRLMEAYEGNRTSANTIRDLFTVFDEIEGSTNGVRS